MCGRCLRQLRLTCSVLYGTYAALGGDFVELWDLESESKLRALEGVEAVSLAFSKGGERLAFAGELGAGYYELPSGNQVVVPSAERYPHNWGVAMTPDGRLLAFGGKRLTLWDTVSRTERPAPQPGKGSVRAIAMSPDGATLAAGAEDGTIHTINMATLKATGSAFAFGEEAWALTFSPDGKVLAAGGNDGKLHLWDVAARQPIGAPLAGHTARISSIAFSPDGSLMAAVGSNRIAIIYDVATRRPLADPLFAAAEYKTIAGAAFTPVAARQLLYSATFNSTVMP